MCGLFGQTTAWKVLTQESSRLTCPVRRASTDRTSPEWVHCRVAGLKEFYFHLSCQASQSWTQSLEAKSQWSKDLHVLCLSPCVGCNLGSVSSHGHHMAGFLPVAFSALSAREKVRTLFFANRKILLF